MPSTELTMNPAEISFVANALIAGKFVATVGGFSSVKRGLVTLPNGRTVFGKLAVDASTEAEIKKEARIYGFLKYAGFPHAPTLLGSTNSLLILPDLSGLDWLPQWTRPKLDAVLGAQHALSKLKPPASLSDVLAPTLESEFRAAWESLQSKEVWKSVLDKSKEFQYGEQLLQAVTSDQLVRLKNEAAFDFNQQKLAHYDLRCDNIAYNPHTREVLFIDWNWTQMGNADLDRTALLLTIFHSKVEGFNLNEIIPLINREAALNMAGFWLEECVKPAIKPGDPDKLRLFQLRLGCTALAIATGMAQP